MVFSFFLLIIIILTYHPWINLSGTLSNGDWPYLFKETIQGFSFFPDPHNLWLGLYYQIPTKIFVEYFRLSWELTEKLLWFWPFIIFSIISSYYLFRSWIGVLIYTTNTYILMVVGGGQMGVALSYSLAPLVLYGFIAIIDSFLSPENKRKTSNSKYLLITGFILAIHVMFDPRIAYVTGIAILLYWIYSIFTYKKKSLIYILKASGYSFGIPILIAFFVNSFWIIPLLQGKTSLQVEGFMSLPGFKFLSFADFSHAFSLLHPNWFENIFGKVYFLQPEFLIIPLLAFSALFFISANIHRKKKVLFFAFLAILGSFLAKGTNEPFGIINTWLFQYFPGMSMFRDASKFYLLIVFGYAFLVPWSLEKLAKKISFVKLLPVVFVLFWCVLIRYAILGDLNGTFKPRSVPAEYIELKQYIIAQPQNSSSLWIPSRQRFGFSSDLHLGISASEILGTSDPLSIAKIISNDTSKAISAKLKKTKIVQIIVPYDSEKELFIVNRKYSNALRDKVIMELDKTGWLVKVSNFEMIAVYRVQ